MTMDPYNKALTGPIWQRVLAPAPGEIPWESLLSGTRRAARSYFALSRLPRCGPAQELRRLAQDKEDQFYALSGLYRLQLGKAPKLPPEKPPAQEPLVPGLCRRYREEASLLAALEATGDPTFSALADRARGNLLTVLALLGRAGA